MPVGCLPLRYAGRAVPHVPGASHTDGGPSGRSQNGQDERSGSRSNGAGSLKLPPPCGRGAEGGRSPSLYRAGGPRGPLKFIELALRSSGPSPGLLSRAPGALGHFVPSTARRARAGCASVVSRPGGFRDGRPFSEGRGATIGGLSTLSRVRLLRSNNFTPLGPQESPEDETALLGRASRPPLRGIFWTSGQSSLRCCEHGNVKLEQAGLKLHEGHWSALSIDYPLQNERIATTSDSRSAPSRCPTGAGGCRRARARERGRGADSLHRGSSGRL